MSESTAAGSGGQDSMASDSHESPADERYQSAVRHTHDTATKLRNMASERWAILYEHDMFFEDAANEIDRLLGELAAARNPFTTKQLAAEMLHYIRRDIPQTIVSALKPMLQRFVETGEWVSDMDLIAGTKLEPPLYVQRLEQELTARSLPLFVLGDFTLHSGASTHWKIDCDALTGEEIATLAAMLSEILPPFGEVEGVPQGGLRIAAALKAFISPGNRLLIVDDVLTTGNSMERQRNGREAIGAVIFARAVCPKWITPLFVMRKKSRIARQKNWNLSVGDRVKLTPDGVHGIANLIRLGGTKGVVVGFCNDERLMRVKPDTHLSSSVYSMTYWEKDEEHISGSKP